jgi:hypothetical protein
LTDLKKYFHYRIDDKNTFQKYSKFAPLPFKISE